MYDTNQNGYTKKQEVPKSMSQGINNSSGMRKTFYQEDVGNPHYINGRNKPWSSQKVEPKMPNKQ